MSWALKTELTCCVYFLGFVSQLLSPGQHETWGLKEILKEIKLSYRQLHYNPGNLNFNFSKCVFQIKANVSNTMNGNTARRDNDDGGDDDEGEEERVNERQTSQA